jgi:transposase
MIMDRDLNSAKNIQLRGKELASIEIMSDFPSGKQLSMNQEAPCGSWE